jgi:SAM-dependent methyltransferase
VTGDLDLMPLPPQELRRGGQCFARDEDFLKGALRDAEFLVGNLGVTPATTVLDFGCGAGRLLYGLVPLLGRDISYVGMDVDMNALCWASTELRRHVPGASFILVNGQNERYNPQGMVASPFPLRSRCIAVSYAYSVFSHMTSAETTWYLHELRRVARSGGPLFLTAFVESEVPPETHNPAAYGDIAWSGPLHCVRYERAHFLELARSAGWRAVNEGPPTETNGQRRMVFAADIDDGPRSRDRTWQQT